MANSKTEREEIDRSGGTPQKNSGRGKVNKGDAILGPFNFDVKEAQKSFTLNRSVWLKVCKDALQSGMYEPALKVVIGQSGEPKTRLWVIDDDTFQQMLGAWSRDGYQ